MMCSRWVLLFALVFLGFWGWGSSFAQEPLAGYRPMNGYEIDRVLPLVKRVELVLFKEPSPRETPLIHRLERIQYTLFGGKQYDDLPELVRVLEGMFPETKEEKSYAYRSDTTLPVKSAKKGRFRRWVDQSKQKIGGFLDETTMVFDAPAETMEYEPAAEYVYDPVQRRYVAY